MKKDLRKFNPDRVAYLDKEMWVAYYKHNFVRMLFLLLKLIHEQFGLNYLQSLQAAYHGAYAAGNFRMKKGHEDINRPLKELIAFYKIISKNCINPFDYKKAAQLELNWWFVDRYPERYQISRERALADAMSVLYNIDSEKLSEYAKYRAQAMVLHDVASDLKKETDWEQVYSLLKMSFSSLHKSVQ